MTLWPDNDPDIPHDVVLTPAWALVGLLLCVAVMAALVGLAWLCRLVWRSL